MASTPILWEEPALRAYYQAFHAHQQDWELVSAAEGVNKSPAQCEALWRQHQSFLSLPRQPALEDAFVALAKDHYNNLLKDVANIKEETQPPHRILTANGSANSNDNNQPRAVSGNISSGRASDVGQPGGMPHEVKGNHTMDIDEQRASAEDGDNGVVFEENEGPDAVHPVELTVRPVRSTRGKPPIKVQDSLDDEQISRGARQLPTTPGKSSKFASPTSAKHRGKLEPLGSAQKKRGRSLFPDDVDGFDTMGEARSPYKQRWKNSGKTTQKETQAFEQGVDALMQLAMATSMDEPVNGDMGMDMNQHSGEEDMYDEPMADEETAGLPAGTRNRPGKRQVRPPSRLDDSYMSPKAATATTGGTPKRARAGSATPTLQTTRSPRGTPRGGSTSWGPSLASVERRGQQNRGKLKQLKEEEDGDQFMDDEETEEEVPRSARARDRRAASIAPSHADNSRAVEEGEEEAANDAAAENNATAFGNMGTLQLPGLPGMITVGGASGTGVGLATSFLPPVSANLGMSPHKPIPANLHTMGSMRTKRRKPAPQRAPPVVADAASVAQQQLFRSLLGVNPLVGTGMDTLTNQPTQPPLPATLETAVTHCLSSPYVRRWVVSEWHYSTIDRPFFMRSELSDLLTTLGLANVHQLTRGEWNLLRAAFGRARRLSLHFLREERIKLEAYREHVRRKYEEVGIGADVPPELPKPLRVGQEVIARHPVTRALHDGVILTIKKDNYRVQFHRTDLMTEVVPDVDVMAANPHESLPALMPSMPVVLNGRLAGLPNGGLSGLPRPKARVPQLPLPASALNPLNVLAGLGPGIPAAAILPSLPVASSSHPGGVANVRPTGSTSTAAAPTTTDPAAQAQQQTAAPNGAAEGLSAPAAATATAGGVDGPENDAALVAEVSAKLEAKEALLARLKEMNSEAESGAHQDRAGRQNEAFQMQYTQVVLQLKEINASLEAAYQRLQARSQVAALGMLQSGAGVVGTQSNLTTSNPPANKTPTPVPPPIDTNLTGSTTPGAQGPPTAASGFQGLPVVDTLTLQSLGLAPSFGLGMSSSVGGMTLPPPVTPADLTAQSVLHAAYQDARSVVERCSAMNTSPAKQGQAAENSPSTERLITGCLTVLCTLQRIANEPILGQAADTSLELAIRSLQHTDDPSVGMSGPNSSIYGQISESIRSLKSQLVKAQ